MFNKLNRFPIKSSLLHFSRLYCYKPVERKHIASQQRIFSRSRRKNPLQNEEYGFNFNIGKIKPAVDGGRSLKVIEALPCISSEFDNETLIETFCKLGVAPISDDALIHEKFNTLIEATKLILPQLTVEQNVQIFSEICRAEIPMFDELTEFIVDTLLRRVACMTIGDIIVTDYSLRSYYAREMKVGKLFETLRQATRAAFIVKVNNRLVDSQGYEKLMQIVRYLSNNQSLVKNIDIRSLSEQLFLAEDQQFRLNDVTCVIISFARVPTEDLPEYSRQLLSKMFRIWCQRTNNFEDVKKILELLVTKKSKDNDSSLLQDGEFISHCSKLTIDKNELRNAFIVMNLFNDLNFVSKDLIDFLSIVFDGEKIKKLNADDYAIYATACVKSSYKPLNFESKFVPAIQSAHIQDSNIHKQIDLALTLHKLGIRHNSFIDYLLKSSAIQVLYKNDMRLNEINKIYSGHRNTVTHAVDHSNSNPYLMWLSSDLEKFIGTNKIRRNVFVSKELTIPLVMKVNTKTGYFMNMQDRRAGWNLICRKNELIICVLTQDVGSIEINFEAMAEIINKQRKLIKQNGWIAITLDESLYGSMPMYKRAFTFFKILLYAINNRRQ